MRTTVTLKRSIELYHLGEKARKDGQSRTSFSFDLNSAERAWWLAGWNDQDSEEEKNKQSKASLESV